MNAKNTCCCCSRLQEIHISSPKGWNKKYFAVMTALIGLWLAVYSLILPLAHWLVFEALGMAPESHFSVALEFFIYDTVKILLLLVPLIYGIAWIRASLNVDRIRGYLAGKRRGLGYVLGALFGSVTPFCSCSSIPLFLGFTTAKIPVGITMAFLITSPLVNELAVVLLWGLLGWKLTILYILVGLMAGIVGGLVMDGLKADQWLQPFIREAMDKVPAHQHINEAGKVKRLTARQRHIFASGETLSIFRRVWKWVIIGVGIGAILHGFVPENWFAEHFGADDWWSVPAAVLVGIPLYSNMTGIIPIMQSLFVKGLPIGTSLAFCMSAVAASIPEVMLLRQILTLKLQAVFIGYLWLVFTLVGWLFNSLGPYIV